MDTSEDRQKQVQHFMKAEYQLWQLITKKLHPYWMSQRMLDTNLSFSANCKVITEFQEQMPMTRRSEVLKDIIIELDKGLTTKKRALQVLNPEMKMDELDELLEEIGEERTTTVEVPDEPAVDEEVEDDEFIEAKEINV